jgi:hypothetical protein
MAQSKAGPLTNAGERRPNNDCLNKALRGYRDLHHETHMYTRAKQQKSLRNISETSFGPRSSRLPSGYARLNDLVHEFQDQAVEAYAARKRSTGTPSHKILSSVRDQATAVCLKWLRTALLDTKGWDPVDEIVLPGPPVDIWRTTERTRTTITGAAPILSLTVKSAIVIVKSKQFRKLALQFLSPNTSDPDARRSPTRLKPFWSDAEAVIDKWLEENGCPRGGDSTQAKLEKYVADWLDARGHEAGTATIRRHVHERIVRFRKALDM